MDVSKVYRIKEMVRQSVEKFGRIDILVNDAALHDGGTILDIKKKDWERIMSINVGGVFLCSKYVTKRWSRAVQNP